MFTKILKTTSRWLPVIVGLAGLLFIISYVIHGYWLRLSGDDFGFVNATRSNFFSYYSGFVGRMAGRFSAALLIFILYQFTWFFIKATPFFFVLFFTWGSYKLTKQVSGSSSRIPSLLIGVLLTITVSIVPTNQYQTFYWLPAYISYGLPLSLFLFVLAYTLKNYPLNKVSKFSLLALCLSALFIGGLHELVAVFGVMMYGFTILLLAMNLLLTTGLKSTIDKIRPKILLLLSPLFGFGLAFVIDYLLPATRYRRSVSPIINIGKRQLLTDTWRITDVVQTKTLHEPILYLFLVFVAFLAIGMVKRKSVSRVVRQIHPFTAYASLSSILFIPFVTLFITVFSTKYGYGTPPPERTVFVYYFSVVLCLLLVGLALGALSTLLPKRGIESTKIFLLSLMVFLVPISFITYRHKESNLFNDVSSHATKFDERDQFIKNSVKSGKKDIVIPAIPIGDTPYPTANKKSDVNTILKDYYGANSIIAR